MLVLLEFAKHALYPVPFVVQHLQNLVIDW